MAKARKKIKIPLVQGILVGAPIFDAIITPLQQGGTAGAKVKTMVERTVKNYTGYSISTKKWKMGDAWGAFTTGAWMVGRKVGVFKEINKFAGRYNVPLLRA